MAAELRRKAVAILVPVPVDTQRFCTMLLPIETEGVVEVILIPLDPKVALEDEPARRMVLYTIFIVVPPVISIPITELVPTRFAAPASIPMRLLNILTVVPVVTLIALTTAAEVPFCFGSRLEILLLKILTVPPALLMIPVITALLPAVA